MEAGISYVEVMVAVLLIAISIGPAVEAIRGALRASANDLEQTANHFYINGRMEMLLAEPFNTLVGQAAGQSTPTSFSDPPGSAPRRLVYISLYDADNADADNNPFTGTEADLLWMRVAIENSVDGVEVLRLDE